MFVSTSISLGLRIDPPAGNEDVKPPAGVDESDPGFLAGSIDNDADADENTDVKPPVDPGFLAAGDGDNESAGDGDDESDPGFLAADDEDDGSKFLANDEESDVDMMSLDDVADTHSRRRGDPPSDPPATATRSNVRANVSAVIKLQALA